jgi:hypothetical protein
MAKMTIEIEVNEDDQNTVDRVDVGVLLRDALAEFYRTRVTDAPTVAWENGTVRAPSVSWECSPNDVTGYVEARYAHMDERFRKAKRREVAKRVSAACAMRRGSVTIHLESPGDSKY